MERLSLLVVWIVAGAGAVGGSIVGGAAGQPGVFIGALIGGTVAAPVGVWLCTRFGWFAAHQRRAASAGAAIGFLIAAPIAATNLHTPVIPVLICSLAGVGALVGAGRARPN